MNRAEQIAHAREVDTRIAEAWTEYHRITTPLPRYRKAVIEARNTIPIWRPPAAASDACGVMPLLR